MSGIAGPSLPAETNQSEIICLKELFMSANVDILPTPPTIGRPFVEASTEEAPRIGAAPHWDPDDFSREQILGLVRSTFFANSVAPRQVIFSAVEPNLDITNICEQVAKTLAAETLSEVALVEGHQTLETVCQHRCTGDEGKSIKSWSSQSLTNLWQVPRFALEQFTEESGTRLQWSSCLQKLRQEFEYVVIKGPSAGISSEAALLGQLTDGIVLVLGARSTRRAIARKLKQMLQRSGCKILGTVLMDRTFPIPERIYHRL
jgi:hypothetical protein